VIGNGSSRSQEFDHDQFRSTVWCILKPTFEEMLIEAWRQAFAENAREVVLGTEQYPIVQTSRRRLLQVEIHFDGQEIRGLEQNPDTKSRWAAMARDGKKVMQFISEGRYFANVVDGKVTMYKK
jgi:hypothetical protein